MESFFIFFVEDQTVSTAFYSKILQLEPTMNVPGMTEFTLPDESRLGFMPTAGIKNLLGDKLPDPGEAKGIPRAEIYLTVADPESFHQRALDNGAVEISPFQMMPWGQPVAYSLDPDGHLLAFAG